MMMVVMVTVMVTMMVMMMMVFTLGEGSLELLQQRIGSSGVSKDLLLAIGSWTYCFSYNWQLNLLLVDFSNLFCLKRKVTYFVLLFCLSCEFHC